MANKNISTPVEVPETHATYERSEDQKITRKQGETSDGKRRTPLPTGGKIVGDMNSEEPDGWDQAPTETTDPQKKRHPRPDGVGGSEAASAAKAAAKKKKL